MGLIRAGYKVAKAAASGASGAEIAKEGVKGMLPRKMGGLVDRVATTENMSRVQGGINNVVDRGRGGTFSDSWGTTDPWNTSSTDVTNTSSTDMYGGKDPWE